MLIPIHEETIDAWFNRTKGVRLENETTIEGVPLRGQDSTQRFYSFAGTPSKEEIENFFNSLYLQQDSNHWQWKEVIAVPVNQEHYSPFVLTATKFHPRDM